MNKFSEPRKKVAELARLAVRVRGAAGAVQTGAACGVRVSDRFPGRLCGHRSGSREIIKQREVPTAETG